MITSARTVSALMFAMSLLVPAAILAQQSVDPRLADLVESGKLRVGVGLGSPHWQ
jgi:hypothetical protein